MVSYKSAISFLCWGEWISCVQLKSPRLIVWATVSYDLWSNLQCQSWNNEQWMVCHCYEWKAAALHWRWQSTLVSTRRRPYAFQYSRTTMAWSTFSTSVDWLERAAQISESHDVGILALELYIKDRVYVIHKNNQILSDLEVVISCELNINQEVVRKYSSSFRKRCNFYSEQNGEHFEQLLWNQLLFAAIGSYCYCVLLWFIITECLLLLCFSLQRWRLMNHMGITGMNKILQHLFLIIYTTHLYNAQFQYRFSREYVLTEHCLCCGMLFYRYESWKTHF